MRNRPIHTALICLAVFAGMLVSNRIGVVQGQQKKAAGNPLRCLVSPQDSADACLFLASDEAQHVTGINLNVNAGSAMV